MAKDNGSEVIFVMRKLDLLLYLLDTRSVLTEGAL